MQKLNKNKKLNFGKISGFIVIMASFLLWPVIYISAQVNSNTNANSNQNKNINVNAGLNANTNANENTNTNANTNAEPAVPEGDANDLNKILAEKRDAISALEEKSKVYQKNIKVKQQEALTLKNQLSILDLQVSQTENDIDTVKQEIEKVNLEITQLDAQIGEKEQEVDYRKEVLSNYLRLIDQYDQRSNLDILMANSSFSEFFDNLRYTEDLGSNVHNALKELKIIKQDLETQRTDKGAKKDELDQLSVKLADSIVSLKDQKDYKTNLLTSTKESEDKFVQLLDQAQREQQSIEGEIGALETKVREKLQQGGVNLNIDTALMWPVNPEKGITAYFHDSSYPFRKYFEHPAIDIALDQGSAVRAAESGYVARAKNAGMGYNYVMIVHNNELSTVYGHLSRIDVSEDDYVVRGQQIGLSGGIPGTPGAGRLTTGAHLHFEVRSNGIPVNPLDYLPSL